MNAGYDQKALFFLYATLSINEPWEKDIKYYDTMHSSINKLQFVYTIWEKNLDTAHITEP